MPAPARRRITGLAPLSILLVIAVAGCGNSGSSPSPTAGIRGVPASPPASAAGSGAAGVNSGDGSSGGGEADSSGGIKASPSAAAAAGSAGTLPIDGSASALQDQMVSVIGRVKPAVVLIETSEGLGSGVVFDAQGDIVTNAHVAGTATSFKVTTADGKSYAGKLVGSFPPDDVAVIKVSATGLTPATFGDSSKLQVGDVVLAMGNPLGLQSSVTEGIVSALGRTVSEPAGNALPDVIQTSAAINPGNSGGALVDLAGEVVGIPTLAATDPQMGGAAAGIGFAISSNRAMTIARQLIQTGHVTSSGRAFLGVTLADTNGGQGVLVYTVSDGGPAAKAGVQPGDLIVSINGQATPDSATLGALLAALHPGDTAHLDVVRQDGSHTTLDVTLGQMPG